MIATEKYTTIMSKILKEGSVGNFQLAKKVIKKGTRLQMYDRHQGRLYYDDIDADFPILTLSTTKVGRFSVFRG